MAWFWGSDEEKHIENTGGVTNRVIVGGTVSIANFEIILLLAIICAIKIFEVVSYIYRRHYGTIRKKYAAPTNIPMSSISAV